MQARRLAADAASKRAGAASVKKGLAANATASAKDALGRPKTITGAVTLQPAKKKKK